MRGGEVEIREEEREEEEAERGKQDWRERVEKKLVLTQKEKVSEERRR